MEFNKICVLGLGYIGLPTASTFAAQGLRVIGVDVNPQVVATLQNGDVHIQEPGLRTLVQAALKSGNLMIRTQPEEADAFIIAVPTPFYDDKRADMRAVTAATEAIVQHLRKGNLVMLESTSPPRTTVDLVAPILERSGLHAGTDFYLAYTPERVAPGKILWELTENDRVIGGIDRHSAEAGRDLYALFVRGDIVLTDATTAEMVKLMENTYRDINIAIANEFSRLADRLGINVWEAISIANRHPRVRILNPGPGVGGHCIGVVPWFLVKAAPDLTPLIVSARQVNDGQPCFVIDLFRRALGDLSGKRIAILGLSFKEDVDDLRESPGIEVARLLDKAGVKVKAFEPYKLDAQIPGITTVPTLELALADVDAFALLVLHRSFRELDPQKVANLTSARIAIDTVNGWPSEAWKSTGFRIYKLGDGRDAI
jgi:UDP-N-acetyl-D-mannosaminuronic acid dehydrogenase